MLVFNCLGIFFALNGAMQAQPEEKLIEEIVAVSEKLIDLAREGNDKATKERSRLFFGDVLDYSFKLQKEAKMELVMRSGSTIKGIERPKKDNS